MLNAYKDLVYSEIGLAATYTRAMEEMYEDNVQYMELRTEISNVRNRLKDQNISTQSLIYHSITFQVTFFLEQIYAWGVLKLISMVIMLIMARSRWNTEQSKLWRLLHFGWHIWREWAHVYYYRPLILWTTSVVEVVSIAEHTAVTWDRLLSAVEPIRQDAIRVILMLLAEILHKTIPTPVLKYHKVPWHFTYCKFYYKRNIHLKVSSLP